MINFLSIDLDYAFSPVISQYDDFIVGSSISQEEQAKINSEHNLPEPDINLDKFFLLTKILKDNKDNIKNVTIAENHHEIIKFLPSELFNLYNFDHHHDIYYPGWHDIKVLDEGNWVCHLKNKLIKTYTWIKNEDSEEIHHPTGLLFPVFDVLYEDIKTFPKFSEVFICSSPQWTGPCSKDYVDALLTLGGAREKAIFFLD